MRGGNHVLKSMKLEYVLLCLMWAIIVLPKELQLLILLGISLVLLRTRKDFALKKNAITIGLILYISINIISVLLNMVSGEHALSRIFASLNTVAIWVIALLLYNIYSGMTLDKKRVTKIYQFNGMLLLLMIPLYILCRITGVNIKFLSRTFVYMYLDDIRIMAFMEYATLVIAFILLVFPLISMCESNVRILLLEYILFGIITVASKSRTGYVVYMLMGAIILITTCSKRILRILGILAIGGSILFFEKIYETIISLLNKLVYMRAGSSQSRMTIYQETLENFLQSPIWGCGIKDIGKAGYPLGSHCTYLGILYRSGILGFIIMSFVFISILFGFWHIYKTNRSRIYLRSVLLFLVMFVFALTEDIDGANWLLVFWSINLGILMNKGLWMPKEIFAKQ